MRIVLLLLCALLAMNFSLEAKKRTAASQSTRVSKQHRKSSKKLMKSRRVKQHRQKVN